MGSIEGVILTPLKIIPGPAGNILHVLKKAENSFKDFGEAYFSTVNSNVTKGWKKHARMTLNVVVPVGRIRFVLYDDRKESNTCGQFQAVELSTENYSRLTVPPGIWMAFTGMGEALNMLLNIADIPHDPTEADSLPLENDVIPHHSFF
jgi:dTDP-4-dehydrorhamnose 3,5-epimerase